MNPNDHPLHELLAEPTDEADPARDPRYVALTEGRLTAEEDAALRALGETSPRHAQAYAAHKPVSDALRAKLFAQAGLVDPLPAPKSAPAPDRPTSLWAIVRARLSAWTLVPALATAVVAGLLLRQPAVPSYQPNVTNLFASAAPSMMGTQETGNFVHAGTVIEVALLPSEAFEGDAGALRASAFAVQGKKAAPVVGPVKPTAGRFRLELPADGIIAALDPGGAELVFFVAAEGDLPGNGAAAMAAKDGRSLAIVRVPVTLP